MSIEKKKGPSEEELLAIAVHKQMVESGLFYKIEKSETYFVGQDVITVHNHNVYKILAMKNDKAIIGYREKTRFITRKVLMHNVRPVENYIDSFSMLANEISINEARRVLYESIKNRHRDLGSIN